jgi:hypothetical protein
VVRSRARNAKPMVLDAFRVDGKIIAIDGGQTII